MSLNDELKTYVENFRDSNLAERVELTANISPKLKTDLENLCEFWFNPEAQEELQTNIDLLVSLAISTILWRWGMKGYEAFKY